jgi:murein DD-endopeptidase MepM/ murein hydrolase activator NlpD
VLRIVVVLTVAVAISLAGGMYVSAGRVAGPTIEIVQPIRLVGRSATFEATIEAPAGQLTSVEATIEQNGTAYPLFSLTRPADAEVRQESANRIRIHRTFDRDSHPDLRAGAARVIVSATRPVLFGWRDSTSSTAADVTVRLDPPRLAALSRFHYLNHGGAELVVYRVTPPDAESGVRVGDRFFPGYPAAGASVEGDESLRVALFALLHDQDLTTPIELYARDAAGNEGRAEFNYRIFPKPFRRSRIEVGDAFLQRVVPPIVARVPELADEEPDGTIADLLDLYLFINSEVRRRNNDDISALAAQTATKLLWKDPFQQLANSEVEAGFADHRTYFHDGREIDQQVHLGFDLASTSNAPVSAANSGTVIHADYLGIFGNCVIIDHGLGLQSLYAHLSSIDVTVGDVVTLDQPIGLSGQTGLAGGDHLHFTMLLQGFPVTPIEWWDPRWIEDRIMRKLTEAGLRGT